MGVGGALGPGAARRAPPDRGRRRRRARPADWCGRGAGLVRDVDAGIEVLCDPPAPGVDLEVHDAPTRHGRLSFALRWHGEHPALLWEVTPDDGCRPRRVELTRARARAGRGPRTSRVGETLLRPTPTA